MEIRNLLPTISISVRAEQIGAGFTFGPRDRYEAGIYVQHVSNADIKEPNYGLTYAGAILRMQL